MRKEQLGYIVERREPTNNKALSKVCARKDGSKRGNKKHEKMNSVYYTH